MPPSKAKKLELEQRRKVVASNILAGANYRDISAALGVSLGTVANDVKMVLQRWQKENVQVLDEHLQIDLRRIDTALNAIWADVQDGKYGAIDRLLRLLERRAKMIGYDQPEKIDLNKKTDPRELTDDELAAIAAGDNAGRRGG